MSEETHSEKERIREISKRLAREGKIELTNEEQVIVRKLGIPKKS